MAHAGVYYRRKRFFFTLGSGGDRRSSPARITNPAVLLCVVVTRAESYRNGYISPKTLWCIIFDDEDSRVIVHTNAPYIRILKRRRAYIECNIVYNVLFRRATYRRPELNDFALRFDDKVVVFSPGRLSSAAAASQTVHDVMYPLAAYSMSARESRLLYYTGNRSWCAQYLYIIRVHNSSAHILYIRARAHNSVISSRIRNNPKRFITTTTVYYSVARDIHAVIDSMRIADVQ